MSGSIPGMPWGNTLNQLARPRYVVKARERMQWTTQTIKGPRRVWRWEKWKEVSRHATENDAWEYVARRKRMRGLEELAVFHGGKRLRYAGTRKGLT